ncbi:tetratricopeptide repeat protein [Candidatus Kaiserbacteria bacterium]|nr:tetratricopeptide repeat protein [Candidatus Kaiserbacteria bacterium]
MKIIQRKQQKLLLLAVVVVALSVIFVSSQTFRESFGWIVWRTLHSVSIATTLNKTDPALLFAIGNYYFGDGAYNTEKAEKYFKKALALDPILQGVHYQLARVYFIKGYFVRALAEINKEIELYPDFGRSHYVRGLIYGYTGQLADAETEFKAFLVWKPQSWAGNNDLAWIYFQEGKYAEARDAARAGLKIAPTNPWLLNALGVALLNLGEKKEAKDVFTQALDSSNKMNKNDWGSAYPGNNPMVYGQGFSQMKESIEENIRLLSSGDTSSI